MPFVSREQVKKCYALKGRGQAGSWNCDEWAHSTPSIKDLPGRKAPVRPVKPFGKRHNVKYG